MHNAICLIFDYGHGCNCPGKCSPDRSLFEWQYNRIIGRLVAAKMRGAGFEVIETWTHDHEPLSAPDHICSKRELDAALNWRVKEVNRICDERGSKNCICISFHSNAAASDDKWHNASGFQAVVGTNASKSSKRLARSVYDAAFRAGLQGNRCVPADHFWTQRLAMCNNTTCPAVLIESFFHDNKDDVARFSSQKGRESLVNAITDGLTNYLDTI